MRPIADGHAYCAIHNIEYRPPLVCEGCSGTFAVSRRDKYKRGDVEASDGWRLFRDGKGKL